MQASRLSAARVFAPDGTDLVSGEAASGASHFRRSYELALVPASLAELRWHL